jgi:antitoxin component YwqK of YwqJK toxin-antitoxin module/CHAT domain-containing protein
MKAFNIKFRQITLLIVILLTISIGYAQIPSRPNLKDNNGLRTGEWVVLYDSAFQHEVTSLDSAVNYLLVRYKEEKPIGITEGFLMNGVKVFGGHLLSIDPTVRHGKVTYYYSNGNIMEEAMYAYDSLNGPFKAYHENGMLWLIGQLKNNKYDGYWEHYYPNGALQYKGIYRQGKEEGYWEFFNDNETFMSKGLYVNGLEEGYWEYYYPNGNIKSKGTLSKGKHEGRWVFYYENGKVKEDAEYKNDLRNGRFEWYYESGGIEQKGTMLDSLENGSFVNYYENGQVETKGEKRLGKNTGLWVGYHENGKKQSEGQWVDGKKSGFWKFYDENGALEQTGELKDNVWNGLMTDYFPNGKVKTTGNYINDKRTGKWTHYFESGNLEQVAHYKEGELHGSLVTYLEDGTLMVKCEYVDGLQHGSSEYHYLNGTVTIGTYSNGLQHGYFKRYYGTSELEEEGEYKEDKKVGPWTFYYENGSKQSEGDYSNDLKTGKWTYYSESDKVRSEGEFHEGLKTGMWKYYGDEGELTATGSFENDISSGTWEYYHPNGQLSKVGKEYADKAHGPWEYFDEEGTKFLTGNWRNGKRHGDWVYVNPKGEVTVVDQYNFDKKLNFQTYYDSIYTLLDYGKTKEAWEVLGLAKKAYSKEWTGKLKYTEVYEATGSIYRKEGNSKKALSEYERALSNVLKYKADTSLWYIYTLPFKAYAYSDMGDYSSAANVYRQIIFLMKQRPGGMQLSTYSQYVNSLATSVNRQGKPEEAIAILSEELNDQKTRNAPKDDISGMYASLVTYADNMGDTELKMKFAFEGMAYVSANDLKLHWSYPVMNYQMGRSLNALGQVDSSRVHYLEALKYYRLSADTVQVTFINTLLRLGDHYYSKSDYANSRGYYEMALQRAAQFGYQNHWIYLYSLNSLAKQRLADGRTEESLEMYREFVRLEEKSDDISADYLSEGYLGIALCLKTLGKKYHDEAEVNFKKSMQVVEGESLNLNYWNGGLIYANFLTTLREKYDDSIAILRGLLNYADKNNSENNGFYALNYQYMGENYYRTGVSDSAIFYFNKVISEVGDDVAVNIKILDDSYGQLANVYERLDDYPKAQSYNFQALILTEKVLGKNNVFYASRLRDIGTNFKLQKNTSSAIKYFNDALLIFDKLYPKDNAYSLNCRVYLGEALRDNEQSRESLSTLNESVAGFNRSGQQNTSGYLRALTELGRSYEKVNETDKAEELFKQVPKMAKGVFGENSSQYARYIREVGLFLSRSNRYDEAYEYLKIAIDKNERIYGKTVTYAWYAEDLSLVQKNREEYVDALALQEEAAEIYLKQTGESVEYMNALFGSAEIYRSMGRFQESIETYDQAIKIIERMHSAFSYPMTQVLTEKAGTYWKWKKPKEGLVELGRVRELFDSLGVYRWNYADLFNLIGLMKYDLNENEEARRYGNMAIQLSDSLWGEKSSKSLLFRNNIAFTYMYEGNFAEAERLWLAAGEIYNSKSQGDLTRVRWLDNMAALYLSWGKLDKAEPYWNEVTDILLKRITGDFAYLSESGKAAFWDANKENFEYFNTFGLKAAAKGNSAVIGQMYDNQLQTKGILLSTSTRERRRILSSGDSVLVNNFFKYTYLKEDLAKYYGYTKEQLVLEKVSVSALEQQASRLEKVLSLDAEGLSSEEKSKAVRWKNIQRTLKPGEAAVEIVRFRYFDKKVTDSVIYAALILTPETKNAPKLVTLPNGSHLEDRYLKAYKSSIQFKLRDERSYAQFWKAIDAELVGVSQVYLSLDGVFNQINIGTLLREDGSYVSDAYTMRIVSSTRDLMLQNTGSRSGDKTAFLFGFPKYDMAHNEIEQVLEERGIARSGSVERAIDLERFGFSELPGTKTETEEITKILEKNNWLTNLYLSDRALEEELKSVANPSVLHIATHGFFLDDVQKAEGSLELGVRSEVSRENPLLRSGLLLTGAAQTARGEINSGIENGIFTAYEAMNLNLQKTELVVLSACETGRGEVKNGEGVYGLQRAFQIAGADAIIMSLWKVDDSATQLLMTEFYKAWTNGKGKIEALKIAQDKVRGTFDHPYYWGAFVLIGS